MPDYKLKTCIIDGREQYDITAANCQNQPTKTRSIRFPGSLLSFVDIEMSEVASLLSEISDGLRSPSGVCKTETPVQDLQKLRSILSYHRT